MAARSDAGGSVSLLIGSADMDDVFTLVDTLGTGVPRKRITAHHSELRDIKETVKERGFESGRQDKISFS